MAMRHAVRLVAVKVAFGLLLVTGCASIGHDWTRGYVPCAQEDSPGPCYWDATKRDVPNAPHKGRSFVVTAAGQVIYR